jgi:hypothetical protein
MIALALSDSRSAPVSEDLEVVELRFVGFEQEEEFALALP